MCFWSNLNQNYCSENLNVSSSCVVMFITLWNRMWKFTPISVPQSAAFCQRCAQAANTARCKQFSDAECWTYASPAMMESISKVLLLNFLSVSMMAAFHKQKSWIKLSEMCLTDFALFLDHGHSLKISVERSIFLLQSYTKIRVQNYSYVQHSAAETW